MTTRELLVHLQSALVRVGTYNAIGLGGLGSYAMGQFAHGHLVAFAIMIISIIDVVDVGLTTRGFYEDR